MARSDSLGVKTFPADVKSIIAFACAEGLVKCLTGLDKELVVLEKRPGNVEVVSALALQWNETLLSKFISKSKSVDCFPKRDVRRSLEALDMQYGFKLSKQETSFFRREWAKEETNKLAMCLSYLYRLARQSRVSKNRSIQRMKNLCRGDEDDDDDASTVPPFPDDSDDDDTSDSSDDESDDEADNPAPKVAVNDGTVVDVSDTDDDMMKTGETTQMPMMPNLPTLDRTDALLKAWADTAVPDLEAQREALKKTKKKTDAKGKIEDKTEPTEDKAGRNKNGKKRKTTGDASKTLAVRPSKHLLLHPSTNPPAQVII